MLLTTFHSKRDFMEFMIGRRVVFIANQDVDAVCTIKVLTNLFKTEGIEYILLSCSSITELKEKYNEYSSQSDTFVLINCGGSIDLLKTLNDPPPQKQFFVIDCHRPVHIVNIYESATKQVRVFAELEDDESIPAFEDVFREAPESDTDEENEDVNEDFYTKETRREHRRNERISFQAWQQNRERILFKHRENSYYGRPSAMYGMEIAWAMRRDDLESFWCVIVALTDSFVMNRISRAKYTEWAKIINDHVVQASNADQLPRECLKIRYKNDLCMFLYRNWSVYESLKATPYPANSLKTWSKDSRALHSLLVQLGLPLEEVKQKYLSMSMDLRGSLVEKFSSEIATEKFNLSELVFGTFIGEIGFRQKFTALDYQLATLAVMLDPGATKSNELKFLDALQVLNVRDAEVFKFGVEKAKMMLKLLVQQVQTMVDKKQMQEFGPFIVLTMPESLIQFNFFNSPASIPLLAQFLQRAGLRAGGKRRWRTCPWIILMPFTNDAFLAVGVQPDAYDQNQKSIFFEVFRVLHEKVQGDGVEIDYFDGWVMRVMNYKRKAFLDWMLRLAEF